MTTDPPASDRSLDELIRYEVDDRGVAAIVIDRPEAKNALTPPMRDRLTELLRGASGDLHVRAVTLTGSGDAFCAGADLRGGRTTSPRPQDAPERAVGDVARTIRDGWQRLVATILDADKPILAGVNGVAAGAGVHLAVACDLVIAAQSARFIELFVRRGIVPDGGGAYLLARLVGPQRAKELAFFGDDVPATRAADIGLVNRVVPDHQVPVELDAWAARLADGPTVALARTKALINRALDVDRATAFAEEALAQEVVNATEDAREGVASFVERRDAEFRGW